MERITDVSKLVYTHIQGGQFRWVTVSTLMLALGTILHLVSPSVGGVTPNWTIATYCVAILLTRPNYKQTLGIGLVAALINVLTSKSGFPYGNLLSEPGGTVACAFVMRLMMGLKIEKIGKLDIMPFVTGFIATCVSGGIFVTILWQVLGLANNIYINAMLPLVVIIGLVNGVVTPLLYFPAKRLFAKRGFLPSSGEITSDHSNYIIEPSQEGKISVEHVNYTYSKATEPSLKDINLVVHEGDFLVITGPAGCGKSTLLKSLNRMNDLVEGCTITGKVELDGEDIYGNMDVNLLRKRVGMVFQKPNPFPMSIYDNIAYGPRTHGIRSKAKLDDIVEKSLRDAAIWDEVKDRLKKSALGMSGGQQQRLCIARALAVQPEVLLMDEPTSALDPISTSKIEDLAVELKKDYTIVMVTHNMQQAARISDKTAFFLLGEVVEYGETEQIFSMPKDKRTEDYITGRFG